MVIKTDTPTVKFLTDAVIELYSESNVLTNYKDIDLNYTSLVKAGTKGVYDPKIFGSIFNNQCNCGIVRTPGVKCTQCGAKVLDDYEAYRRYARIETPVYYCTELKLPLLLKWLKSKFIFKFDFRSNLFSNINKITQEVIEVCQFEYIEEENSILVTDIITDINKCSYEGLLALIRDNYKKYLVEFNSYINTTVLVPPIVTRPAYYRVENGERKLEFHIASVTYQTIIYISHEYYPKVIDTIKSEENKSLFRAIIRRFISKSLSNLSGLTRTSKGNYARLMQSNRVTNSGRCTIVPAPDLKVDEVYIPRHLMYEACREEFTQFLADHYGYDLKRAELTYRMESGSPEIQELFDKYIEGDGGLDKGKYVLINRNPTLYELNMLCNKVKLTNDYVIGLPIQLCSLIAGDFDGDQMSFYAVPKERTEEFLENMSPRNIIYYKENMNPVFMPNHEIMHGMIVGTKVKLSDTSFKFDSVEDALDFRKENPNFRYRTMCEINGKITTIARALYSEYFDTDLEAYLGDININLNSKNILPLYNKIASYKDRVERLQKIQDLSLLLTTLSGSTAPKLSDLYVDVDKSFLDRIIEVEENDKLSDKEKDLKIRVIYEEFVESESKKIPKEVKSYIEEGSRAKLNQLLSISLPQLNIGPEGDYTVTVTQLLSGKTSRDYEAMAIENRAIQDIKTSSVPLAGNLTRHFVYLASNYRYFDGDDPNNKGILLPKKEAAGRTMLNGKIVEPSNSNELVRVRSIVGSTYKEDVITRDVITSFLTYNENQKIGISMITSLTKELTQSGLSLKHGGYLFQLENEAKLKAPDNVEFIEDPDFIILRSSSRDYKYPRPDNFVINRTKDNFYKKGDLIGVAYHAVTPSYRLDSVIKLTSARSITPDKAFARNKVLVTDCYVVKSGKIKYIKKGKSIKVYVGDVEYAYNPYTMYFYPEGTQLNEMDRMCNGVMNLSSYSNKVKDYEKLFYYFKDQFNALISNLSSELIEFLYVLLVKKIDGRIRVKGVVNSIHESKSFYTTLSFENAKKTFRKIDHEGIPLIGDTMTNVILSLIINNKNI